MPNCNVARVASNCMKSKQKVSRVILLFYKEHQNIKGFLATVLREVPDSVLWLGSPLPLLTLRQLPSFTTTKLLSNSADKTPVHQIDQIIQH